MTPPLLSASDAARTLRSGFLRSAAANPEAPALVLGEDVVSYGELERQARAWALSLCRRLGRPARRIGVFAYRSRTAYAGTLSALFAGAAFVPLNRTFPVQRTRSMVGLAELDAIIVDAESSRQLSDVLSGLDPVPPLLLPDSPGGAAPAGAVALTIDPPSAGDPDERLPGPSANDPAYLLFTSGSTGTPKGVPISHANVLHFIDVMMRRYDFSSEDRFSQTFDQTFDLSVFDLFLAWEAGARVCAMQPLDLIAPGRFARHQGLTVWFSVPSIPALMMRKGLLRPDTFPSLRWSLFCGEPLPAATAVAWQAAAPRSTVENLYGPTELTIACFVHRWSPELSPPLCLNGIVPIGRPFEGLTEVVVDDGLRDVPQGESGELCVTGPQTFAGYWQDPGRSAERLVELAASPGARFYRTGDRVRRLASGDYAYLGRVDDQIKVLGHRVELGEIEAVLRDEGRVVQAVAAGWPTSGGTSLGIVAFVCGPHLDAETLRARCRARLPDYMVPSRFIQVDEMPLSPNGKVDRNRLVAGLDAESSGQGET